MLSATSQPNLAGVENVLALAVRSGGLNAVPPLDTWIDLSYLDRARR
jgi:hypothetical protein